MLYKPLPWGLKFNFISMNKIDGFQKMIKPYVESDPSAFYTTEEFEKAVSTMKTFCARRAESIRGQLEGTIPSTTQGQRTDSASLIDASEISTADMGKMDNGNNQGGGMPSGMPDMGFMPGTGSETAPSGMPDMGSMPDFGSGMTFPGMPGSGAGTGTAETPATDEAAEIPAADTGSGGTEESTVSPGEKAFPEGFSGEPPDGGFPGGESFSGGGYSSDIWIWTAGCAATLLAAVLIIRKIRNHNN